MLPLVALLLGACSKTVVEHIDYLPCQTAGDSTWSFISPQGEVILGGQFATQPGVVNGGMFTLPTDNGYSLHIIKEGRDSVLADSLMTVGIPAYGRIPVCREAGKVQILDALGKDAYVLADIEGQTVIGTAPGYELGLLKVQTLNSLGMNHAALLDVNGEVVLPPHYTDIRIISDDIFWVMLETRERSRNDSIDNVRQISYFINRTGERLNKLPSNLMDVRLVGSHFAGIVDSTQVVYSFAGERIAACPLDSQLIVTFTDSMLILNKNGEYYGADFAFKPITRTYSEMNVIEDGVVGTLADSTGCELLSMSGNIKQTLKGWMGLKHVEGFGYIAHRGKDVVVWDYHNEQAIGTPVSRIATEVAQSLLSESSVSSDTYGYDYLTDKIISHLLSDPHQLGVAVYNTVPYVTCITEQDVETFSRYASAYDCTLLADSDCYITMHLDFDTLIVREKYIFESATVMNQYGDNVITTKKKKDGYEYNTNAHIIGIDYAVSIDSSVVDVVSKRVLKRYQKQCPLRDSVYVDGQAVVSVRIEGGKMLFHCERDPKVIREAAIRDSIAAVEKDSLDALTEQQKDSSKTKD